jgi:virulence factor
MGRVTIGIVGLGDIARKVYLPLLAANEAVEVVGLQSRTPATVEQVGEQYRIAPRFTELEALLAQKPQAVFVHSPTETHYDIVMTCLRQGVHVYVDKPLSYDYGESERMAEEAEKRGLLLAVGFNRRFAPLYVEAKAWMEAGSGGFEWAAAQKHRVRQQEASARVTVYDDLIHMLDLLLWLRNGNGGAEAEITAAALAADEAGRMLSASGCLSLRQGGSEGGGQRATESAAASYSMVRLAGRDLEKLELHGGGRSAEVVNMETAHWSAAGSLPLTRTFGSWETVLERRGFAGVVKHFLECLDDPAACSVRADRVLASHLLAERAAPKESITTVK